MPLAYPARLGQFGDKRLSGEVVEPTDCNDPQASLVRATVRSTRRNLSFPDKPDERRLRVTVRYWAVAVVAESHIEA